MKIRKIHLKDHPLFGTADIDFTDKNGKTPHTVVLAGINGSHSWKFCSLFCLTRAIPMRRIFLRRMSEVFRISPVRMNGQTKRLSADRNSGSSENSFQKNLLARIRDSFPKLFICLLKSVLTSLSRT